MVEIAQLFKAVEEPATSGAHSNPIDQLQPAPEQKPRPDPEPTAKDDDATPERIGNNASATQPEAVASAATTNNAPGARFAPKEGALGRTSSTGRPVQVFHAPTSSTPGAAALPHNEADYVIGIEHAQLHQARLNKDSRNKRLLSDAEIAAKERDKQATMSTVHTVRARIRLPDQDTIVIDFSKEDTGADVYTEVRSRMQNPAAPFRLMYYGDKAQHVRLEDGSQRLIPQLGWRGSMQVNMLWDDDVPTDVRNQPCLSDQWRSQRQQIQPVQQPAWQESDEPAAGSGKLKGGQVGGKGASVEDKLKSFLGLGRKK